MTYYGAAQWDLQGVKVGAWAEGAELGSMAEKVVWATLLGGIFAASLPGYRVIPGFCPPFTSQQSFPAKVSRWIRVGGRDQQPFQCPTFPPSLVPIQFPSLPCVPSGTTIFLSSCQQSSLKESSAPTSLPLPISTSLLISWAHPIWAFLPPCSYSLVTQLTSLLWGVNLISNHVSYLPERLGSWPQIPPKYLFFRLLWQPWQCFST